MNKKNISIIIVVVVLVILGLVYENIIKLPFLQKTASTEVNLMKIAMVSINTFSSRGSITIQSDKVAALSDQPINVVLTYDGVVDKSNNNPKSSGSFNISLNVQGTSFSVKGDYAIANGLLYYNIHDYSKNLPLNLAPLQNKWVYSKIDSNNFAQTIEYFVNQPTFYKNAVFKGTVDKNGFFVENFNKNLTKTDLQKVLIEKSNKNNINNQVQDKINQIVAGVQSSSLSYSIGSSDHLPYNINLIVNNKSINGANDFSNTIFTVDFNMSNFNKIQKVTIPSDAVSLQSAK